MIPDYTLTSPMGRISVTFSMDERSLAVETTNGLSRTQVTATPDEAIGLARAILCAYAPHLLVSPSKPVRTDAARFSSRIELGPFVEAKLLRGGFVNTVQGARAPSVAHPNLESAKVEATRLAAEEPGKLVITSRIEAVQKAVTKVEEF